MIYGMKPKNLSYPSSDYLAHFGVAGQKWGKRQYQNEDGSLTPEGREHYGVGEARRSSRKEAKERTQNAVNAYKERASKDPTKMTDEELRSAINRMNLENNYMNANSNSQGARITNEKSVNTKKIIAKTVSATVIGGGAAAAAIMKNKEALSKKPVSAAVKLGLAAAAVAAIGPAIEGILTVGLGADKRETALSSLSVTKAETARQEMVVRERKAAQEAANHKPI